MNVEVVEDKDVSENIQLDQEKGAIDLKAVRKQQWIEVIEGELREAIKVAADLDQKIRTAKTQTKSKYHKKKFDKVTVLVKRYIGLLEQLKPGLTEELHGTSTITTE